MCVVLAMDLFARATCVSVMVVPNTCVHLFGSLLVPWVSLKSAVLLIPRVFGGRIAAALAPNTMPNTAVRREARQETARAGVVRPCAVEDARRRARGLGFVRQGGIAAVGPQAGLCRARRQGVGGGRFMSLLSHYCLQAYAVARSSCVVGGRVCVVLLLS